MWADIFKRWADLAFWWMPRTDRKPDAEKAPGDTQSGQSGRTQESSAPEKASSAGEPASPAPAAATSQAADDDLTAIKGIGPATQKALRGQGIRTFADLANADAPTLAEKLKDSQPTMTESRVRGWVKAAREQS